MSLIELFLVLIQFQSCTSSMAVARVGDHGCDDWNVLMIALYLSSQVWLIHLYHSILLCQIVILLDSWSCFKWSFLYEIDHGVVHVLLDVFCIWWHILDCLFVEVFRCWWWIDIADLWEKELNLCLCISMIRCCNEVKR